MYHFPYVLQLRRERLGSHFARVTGYRIGLVFFSLTKRWFFSSDKECVARLSPYLAHGVRWSKASPMEIRIIKAISDMLRIPKLRVESLLTVESVNDGLSNCVSQKLTEDVS